MRNIEVSHFLDLVCFQTKRFDIIFKNMKVNISPEVSEYQGKYNNITSILESIETTMIALSQL